MSSSIELSHANDASAGPPRKTKSRHLQNLHKEGTRSLCGICFRFTLSMVSRMPMFGMAWVSASPLFETSPRQSTKFKRDFPG